jgi:hypothetical protein
MVRLMVVMTVLLAVGLMDSASGFAPHGLIALGRVSASGFAPPGLGVVRPRTLRRKVVALFPFPLLSTACSALRF